MSELKIGMYPAKVVYFKDRKGYKRMLDKLKITTSLENYNGIVLSVEDSNGFVCILGVFDNNMGTLVHESVHAAHRILDRFDSMYGPEEGEPLAYLVEAIFEEGRRLNLAR